VAGLCAGTREGGLVWWRRWRMHNELCM